MLRLVLALVAAAALAAPIALGGKTRALDELRVCTRAEFDEKKSECKKGEAADHPLISKEFYCSARIDAPAGTRVVTSFYASDELVSTRTLTLTKNVRTVYFRVYRTPGTIFGNLPLLGGTWKCRISVPGEGSFLSFQSGGPTQLVLDRKVCGTASTTTAAGWAVCPRDQSASAIHSSQVTCSAFVAGVKGQVARIDLLKSGKQATKVAATVKSISQPFSAQWTGLTAGSYSCRWLLNGKPIALQSFRVG